MIGFILGVAFACWIGHVAHDAWQEARDGFTPANLTSLDIVSALTTEEREIAISGIDVFSENKFELAGLIVLGVFKLTKNGQVERTDLGKRVRYVLQSQIGGR